MRALSRHLFASYCFWFCFISKPISLTQFSGLMLDEQRVTAAEIYDALGLLNADDVNGLAVHACLACLGIRLSHIADLPYLAPAEDPLPDDVEVLETAEPAHACHNPSLYELELIEL